MLEIGSLCYNFSMSMEKVGVSSDNHESKLEEKVREIEILLKEAKEENKELEATLQRAGIDGLTGLLRREQLEPRLEKLIATLKYSTEHSLVEQRHSSLKAILVLRLDVNKLKKFNEAPYNHHVGDQVLVTFARRLEKVTKEGDILVRIGGDEFVVVMPVLDDNVDFIKFSEDVKNRINKNLFIEVNKDILNITASVGYSVTEKGEKNTEQLLIEADLSERKDKNSKIVLEDYSI